MQPPYTGHAANSTLLDPGLGQATQVVVDGKITAAEITFSPLPCRGAVRLSGIATSASNIVANGLEIRHWNSAMSRLSTESPRSSVGDALR